MRGLWANMGTEHPSERGQGRTGWLGKGYHWRKRQWGMTLEAPQVIISSHSTEPHNDLRDPTMTTQFVFSSGNLGPLGYGLSNCSLLGLCRPQLVFLGPLQCMVWDFQKWNSELTPSGVPCPKVQQTVRIRLALMTMQRPGALICGLGSLHCKGPAALGTLTSQPVRGSSTSTQLLVLQQTPTQRVLVFPLGPG